MAIQNLTLKIKKRYLRSFQYELIPVPAQFDSESDFVTNRLFFDLKVTEALEN